MTSTRTVSVNAEELRTTFEFVSFGAPLEHSAYICVDTGKIYCHSVSAGLEEEEDLPEDFETSDRYIAVPHKNDLGLGRRIALAFVDQELSDEYGLSPQAPVETANSAMMQPIARTHRRRTTIAFDASPRQPRPMPTSGNRVTRASDPVAASSLATDATAQAKKATAQVRRRRNTSASMVSKQRSKSVRAVRIVKTTRPTR